MSADRDVIDLSDHPANPAEQHLQFVRDLIAHRAPEIDPGEISDAFPTQADPGESVWLEAAERVLDALGEVDERLQRLEAMIKEDDDDDGDERDRRQV